jgi:hypothetical protein
LTRSARRDQSLPLSSRRGRSVASRLWGFLLLAWALAASSPARAALFSLSETARTEAIRLGQDSVTRESIGDEWTTSAGGVEVTVMTPFHRLAALARQAAFRQATLKPRDIERAERENRGRLVIWATLRGDRADFARFLAPVLLVGVVEVRPAFVQNERTALRQPDGRYVARCAYAFPTTALNPRGKVSLVVRDQEGRREVARVPIDLGTFR